MHARYPGPAALGGGFSFGPWIALETGAADERVTVAHRHRAAGDEEGYDFSNTQTIHEAQVLHPGEVGRHLPAQGHAEVLRRAAGARRSWSIIDTADHLFDGQTTEVGEALEDLLAGFPWHDASSSRPCGRRSARRRTERCGIRAPTSWRPIAITEALRRAPGLDASEIDDVILGCAMPEAEQGLNVARIASLRAGVPVDRVRGHRQPLLLVGPAGDRLRGRAHHVGGRATIVAGGTESMSLVPMGGNKIVAESGARSTAIPTST